MKRRLLIVAGMSVLLAATAAPAPGLAQGKERFGKVNAGRRADTSALPSQLGRNRRVMIAVELEGRPVALYQGAALAAGQELSAARKADLRVVIGRRQAVTRTRIERMGADVEATYTDVLNGFRVRARARQLQEIAALPGVKAVHLVPKHQRSTANTIGYLGADRTWAQTDFTGKGVTIAVIDSGINFYHADFNGAGLDAWKADNGRRRDGNFPTGKVVDGYDLVGDDYNADDLNPIREPDGNPLDCKRRNAGTVQHGTHVAGIAAGTGVTSTGKTFKGPYTPSGLENADLRIAPGVAPEAKLMAFRVFGCDGSTYVTVDAIEMAVRAGADVINLSLGTDFGNPGSVDSLAVDNASLAGTTVVASSGNAGPSAYITGAPGSALRAISVGAMDALSGYPGARIDMRTGGDINAINANDAALPVSGRLVVFRDDPKTPGDPDTGEGFEDSGCAADSYEYNDFQAGRIAVVQRGQCARTEKAVTGDREGAAAVIQVNTTSGLPPYEQAITGVDIPFIGVSAADDGRFVTDDGRTVTIRSAGGLTNDFYRSMADFSSAGPGRVRDLIKPDVSAPGVSVFSADGSTVAQGKSLSGTSMASPAVAGVAALVKQAHPGWDPRSIKAAIVGTALAGRISPYEQRQAGAGLANPRRAVDTKAFVFTEPGSSSLTFGYQPAGDRPGTRTSFSERRSLKIRNTANHPITYDLANDFTTSARGLRVSIQPSRVSVPARSQRSVTVVVSMTESAAGSLPLAAPLHTASLAEDDYGQMYTDLSTIAGFIRATPRGGGTGVYPLVVPWLVVPRPLSRLQELPNSRTAWASEGTRRESSVAVRNYGLRKGIADIYAWGLQDGEESLDRIDLRAAGVQSVDSRVCDSSARPNDRCLVFAINLWDRFSSASEAEYDIVVSTDGDSQPEYIIAAIDLGLVFDTLYGITGSVIFTYPDFEYVNAYFAGAGSNGSTVLMPALASDLGLRPNARRTLRYSAESYQLYDDDGLGTYFDVMGTGLSGGSATAQFDAFDPVLNTGAFRTIQPGATKRIGLSIDSSRYRPKERGQKGWMMVTLEDEDGRFQADLIPVGPDLP